MKMNEKIKQRWGVTEINLTSLVDVCLTLVIIFMVSYPLVMQSGINISTPSLQKAQSSMEETELKAEITLTENDSIELNGKLISPAVLPDSLKSIMQASRDKMVLISAASSVLHDRVVAVLDIAKQSGAQQLSIIKYK
jgi:biopolymer transport protein ExbD